MNRSIFSLSVAIMAALMLALATPAADAGRMGGPFSAAGMVPTGLSVFYEIPFAANAPATVTIVGDNNSILYVVMYDADGHVATASATLGRPGTVTMNVYRAGTFRVEVRNLGLRNAAFQLLTN